MKEKAYSSVAALPAGQYTGPLTPGCMVLEGGAFRGVYTSGVLDALLQAGIQMQCTIGVSAGALTGLNYVAGQIGRAARINLTYRHDPRYVGAKALRRNRGVIGFDFLFDTVNQWEPFDEATSARTDRRFLAVATDCTTGRAVYFEKGACPALFQAVRASASMPFVSKPVWIDGTPYLDGGCADKIPYAWALAAGFEKIIVVRTRPADYRKTGKHKRVKYPAYPLLAAQLAGSGARYNRQCQELEALEQAGRLVVISPSADLQVTRLEGDMEKLGRLYWMGNQDANAQLERLRAYLVGSGKRRKKEGTG